MGENENKNESKHCCCCQSWKALFIAIAFMAIGAVFGHMMTMMHMHCCGHYMMGPCGGWGMGECRERGERECEGRFEHKCWGEKEGYGEREEKSCERKGDMEKCPKKAACVAEPNKPSCPMSDKDKKEGKAKK